MTIVLRLTLMVRSGTVVRNADGQFGAACCRKYEHTEDPTTESLLAEMD